MLDGAEDAFDAIFAHIDRDIEDGVDGISDIEFGNADFETIFVYIDRDVEDGVEDAVDTISVYTADSVKDNVEDARETASGNKDCFVEIVSMLIMADKIREDSFVDRFNCNSCFKAVASSMQFCNFCIFFL